MTLPNFVMDKRGNYAVYHHGEYTGYAVHRNGGDRLPTYVFYKGKRMQEFRSLETAKNYITGRIMRKEAAL